MSTNPANSRAEILRQLLAQAESDEQPSIVVEVSKSDSKHVTMNLKTKTIRTDLISGGKPIQAISTAPMSPQG